MAYPTDLPSHKTDWANNTPVADTHPDEHNEVAVTVNALAAKVGVNSSAVQTSHDYKLSEVTGADKAVGISATQTLLNKTLTSPFLTTPQINDTSGDHQYNVAVNELAADRTVTLPLLAGNDTFVFQAHNQTLTNKTIDADNNTISNLEVSHFKGSAIVTEAEGIDSSDNDTSIPTSAAVKNYVDTNAGSIFHQIEVVAPTTNVTTGNKDAYFRVPQALNGLIVNGVGANVISYGVTGTTSIQLLKSRVGWNTHSLDLERGSSQYASITDGSQTGLDFGANDFTIEARVKVEDAPSSGQVYTIVSKYTSSGNQRGYTFGYQNDGGTTYLKCWFSGDGSATTQNRVAQTLTPGTWYHVAVKTDISAGSSQFFVNGASIGTASGSTVASLHNSTAPFAIGAMNVNSTPDNFFDGLIDEVRVWNTLLSDSSILSRSYGYAASNASGLVSYWKLDNDYSDETSGNTLTASGSPVFSIDRQRLYQPVLSTELTIDSGEYDSIDAATPAVIDQTANDLETGDLIRVRINSVQSGTAPQGLNVSLTF